MAGTGNGLANTLTGNAGNNVLDGRAGADTMIGEDGDDTYQVDDPGDVIVEGSSASSGTDTVYSPFAYTLDVNLENLVLTGAGDDTGTGNEAANRLDGSRSPGANLLSGGSGDDTYVLGAGDTAVERAGEGLDTVVSWVNHQLGGHIEIGRLAGTLAIDLAGNDTDNSLYGNDGDNRILGGGGDDTIVVSAGHDRIDAGPGSDVIVVPMAVAADTVIASADEGSPKTDVLRFDRGHGEAEFTRAGDDLVITVAADGARVVVEHFFAAAATARIDRFEFGEGTVMGPLDFDFHFVSGTAGDDTLAGSSGIDLMEGLGGDDALSGMAGADRLEGGTGNDSLDGGGEADRMAGGPGDDVYVVDDPGDQVAEEAGEGNDTVRSTLSYTLPTNVENLTLLGTVAIYGTGNALNNVLAGNGAANVLSGGPGDDTYVFGAGDTVVENAGEGVDTVQSGLSHTLGANLENLILTGTAAINGKGNALDNVLTGNGAANALAGGAGNDTYYVAAGDTVTESTGQGTDTVVAGISWILGANLENLYLAGAAPINATGNATGNVLVGNAADNRLNGGSGADLLSGGRGDGTYVVDNIGDSVVEAPEEGVDTVQSSVSFGLGANVEHLTLTGTGAINGTGNSLDNHLTDNRAANTLAGAAGDDTLNGGAGGDKLYGGAGNDTYLVDAITDRVYENANEGIDTVLSKVSYTLGANVENLTLTGTYAINGTGNGLANTMIGNGASNVLNGGAGADTLSGGGGRDTFKLDTVTGGADIIEDFLSGTDLIRVNSGSSGLAIGDRDGVIDGARMVAEPGGFWTSDELVIVTGNISGAITPASAAAAIGSANGAYANGRAGLFVVDNGADSALFKFVSADADAVVEAPELTLIGTLHGTAATGLSDWGFWV